MLAQQQPGEQAQGCGDADGLPRVLAHILVGGVTGGLGAVYGGLLQVFEFARCLGQPRLNARAHAQRALADLVCGHAQQLLGVLYHQAQVMHQLCFVRSVD